MEKKADKKVKEEKKCKKTVLIVEDNRGCSKTEIAASSAQLSKIWTDSGFEVFKFDPWNMSGI